MELAGSVFSGHSTKTTLGNTLRSLLYVYYYISAAGISATPWNMKNCFVMAAGDDVTIFCDPTLTRRIKRAIRAKCVEADEIATLGLG